MLNPSVYLGQLDNLQRKSLGSTVNRLIEMSGGLADLVHAGSRVLLKPDIFNTGSEADRTSAELVAAVGRMVQDCGGKVVIGDSPIIAEMPVEHVWQRSGLREKALREDYELVSIERAGSDPVAVDTRVYYISRVALEADIIINLPKLRRDRWTGIAGAIGNMFGVLPGFQKGRLLARNFTGREIAGVLVDVYASATPDLNIIDATYINGATGNRAGVVAVSNDGVALDRVIASCCGIEPGADSPISLASDAGLGIGWLEGIRVVGKVVDIERIMANIGDLGSLSQRFPARLMNLAAPLATVTSTVESNKCDGCGICVSVCPTNAIKIQQGNRVPSLSKSLCVRCWCCQANCPTQAIRLEPSYLAGTFFQS